MRHVKEAFEHNNPRDTICTLHLFLNDFTVEIYSNRHPLRRHLCKLTIKIAKEPGIVHAREQDKVSFTARPTTLILQQYKIGFKVEFKYITSAVVVNRSVSTDKGLLSFSRKAKDTNKRYGK